MRRDGAKGFSLIELLIVLGILSLTLGVIFNQINSVQKMNRTEDQKLDLNQEAREFIDQFTRDLHNSGYPNVSMWAGGVLGSPPQNDSKAAAGLVKFAYDEVWFEGDVDQDGTVESVNYYLEPDSGAGKCPCRLRRSQVPKANATAPWLQTKSYQTELQGVINSGGANSGASGTAAYPLAGSSVTGGATRSYDVLFVDYKSANVFTAYDAAGNPVAPATYGAGGPGTLANIKTIRINLNLLARNPDLQTGRPPVISMSAAGKVVSN